MKRGNVISGLEHLGAGTDELRDTGFTPDYPTFLGAMAEGLAGAGRVVRAWRPSRKRLRDPCVAVNSGAWRTCYASKARLSSVRARAALPPWLRTTSSKAWTWRAGKVRVPGNYAASPASPGCGATRLGAKRRASSWRRCTIGLQRAWRPPTSERQRRCSKSCYSSKKPARSVGPRTRSSAVSVAALLRRAISPYRRVLLAGASGRRYQYAPARKRRPHQASRRYGHDRQSRRSTAHRDNSARLSTDRHLPPYPLRFLSSAATSECFD